MKATSSKKFQKPTLGQNVRIKKPDTDRAKMDPRPVIAVITYIKDEEFYELGTKLGKLKASLLCNSKCHNSQPCCNK
jgi:hypothetical protein